MISARKIQNVPLGFSSDDRHTHSPFLPDFSADTPYETYWAVALAVKWHDDQQLRARPDRFPYSSLIE